MAYAKLQANRPSAIIRFDVRVNDKGQSVIKDAIAITDSMVSPLVKSADSVLIARSDMASIVDSLVAPLSLINALIVATVLKKKDEVSENFRRLETVWNREGVYASGEKNGEEETEAGKNNGK